MDMHSHRHSQSVLVHEGSRKVLDAMTTTTAAATASSTTTADTTATVEKDKIENKQEEEEEEEEEGAAAVAEAVMPETLLHTLGVEAAQHALSMLGI